MSEGLEQELLALGAGWRGAVQPQLRTRVAAIARGSAGSSLAAASPDVSRRRRSPSIAAGALVLAVAAFIAIPGARVSIARQGVRVLQTLRIAPSTQLQTDDARTAEEVNASLRHTARQLATGRMWHVSTVYGGFGGSVRDEESPEVQRVDRVAVVSLLAPMRLIGPTGFYRGEDLSFHHALVAPAGYVLAFFSSGDSELLLVQAPVGRGQQVAYSRVVSGPGGALIGVAPSTETLTVNGQTLTWDPDTTGMMPNNSALRWEANGVSYSLYGRALMRDEAVALFSTLCPLPTESRKP